MTFNESDLHGFNVMIFRFIFLIFIFLLCNQPEKSPLKCWTFNACNSFVCCCCCCTRFLRIRTLRYASMLKRTRSFRFGWLRKVIKNACRVLHAKMEGSEETRCIWIGNKCREWHLQCGVFVCKIYLSAFSALKHVSFRSFFYLCQMHRSFTTKRVYGHVFIDSSFVCISVVSFKMLWE